MVTRCIALSTPGATLPQPALIGPRRIGEPVAQHPDALRQRRLDHGAHMVVARGGKQQRLRFRAEQLAHPRQHEMADDFGARRAAGLARDDGAQFCRLQTLASSLIWVDFPDPSPPSKEMNLPRTEGRLTAAASPMSELLGAGAEHADDELARAVDRAPHGRSRRRPPPRRKPAPPSRHWRRARP